PFATAEDPKRVPAKVGSPKISGPYHCDNLTVFLIHGSDQLEGKNILTLQEAMEKKVVVVHETKNVQQLSIENVSADVEVFVQSGDIVKGGQQDRAIAFDMILPPQSGKVSLACCCCEQGRWSKRGKEEVGRFGESSKAVPS